MDDRKESIRALPNLKMKRNDNVKEVEIKKNLG
jgi:hypothetical protein